MVRFKDGGAAQASGLWRLDQRGREMSEVSEGGALRLEVRDEGRGQEGKKKKRKKRQEARLWR